MAIKRVTDYFTVVPAKKVAKVASAAKLAAVSQDPVTSKDSTVAREPLKPALSNENTAAKEFTSLKDSTISPESTSSIASDAALLTRSSGPASESPSSPTWDKSQWVNQLSPEVRELLKLEIDTLDTSWLEYLHKEIAKPYFLSLKKFLRSKRQSSTRVFPPEQDVYSWSRLTPLSKVKVLVLGQDPYHNVGQAHGLAFSVRHPTPPPPSLVNIYKELKNCYPNEFVVPKHGSLTKWASQGVLMLNACLTVDAHQANSHANKGWEQFTEEVVKLALRKNPHVVIMAWGSPAAKRVERARPGSQHVVLRSVHPSPLSASRGWFGSAHFTKANEWLEKQGEEHIDWNLPINPE